MNTTEHYQLNQWDGSDRILRTDFNADNAKVDAALAEQAAAVAEHTQRLAACGNCQIYHTRYNGTGESGSSAPSTLTFPYKPMFVAFCNTSNGENMLAIYNSPNGYSRNYISNNVTFIWSGNTLSWYASAPNTQLNEARTSYTVVALLAVDG